MNKLRLFVTCVAGISLLLGAVAFGRVRITCTDPELYGCTVYPDFLVVAHDAYVNHDLQVGPSNETFISGDGIETPILIAGEKEFKIDDPDDPANKYLFHSSVESSDMKNIYDGVVTLETNGRAWVQLPTWFQSLNTDFRYQLTAIGAPGRDLYVSSEVSGGHFQIAGGFPGLRVSWQLTGNRHDPTALRLRRPVEQDKPAAERGKYFDPKAYGQPPSSGLRSQLGLTAGSGRRP